MKIFFGSPYFYLNKVIIIASVFILSACSNKPLMDSIANNTISKQYINVILHKDKLGNFRSSESIEDKEIEVVFNDNIEHHEIIFKLWLKEPEKSLTEIKEGNYRTFITFVDPTETQGNSVCKTPKRWIDYDPQNLIGVIGKKIKLANNQEIHPDSNCYVSDVVVYTPHGETINIDPLIRIRRDVL